MGALEPGWQDEEQQQDIRIKRNKAGCQEQSLGEMPWSETLPEGTDGNFAATSALERLGDAPGICSREHPTKGRSLLHPGHS